MNPIELLTPLYERELAHSLSTYQNVPTSLHGGPANPLLIRPPDNYTSSTLKIMYFGQETNGYEGPFNKTQGVQHLLRVYDAFANKAGWKRYRGFFWTAVPKFNEAFSRIDSNFAFTTNNLIKVGMDWSKGSPPEPVLKWQGNWTRLIREELRILDPDVVIFMTGPNYDRCIERAFGPFALEAVGEWPTRQLSRIISPELPAATFRTYHPGYSLRHDFYEHLAEIVGEFKKLKRGAQ